MKSKEKKDTIRVFLWASFLNDMGSDMIYPVWPLFVTTVLNANMAALGFLDGLWEALVSVSQASIRIPFRQNKKTEGLHLVGLPVRGYIPRRLRPIGNLVATVMLIFVKEK